MLRPPRRCERRYVPGQHSASELTSTLINARRPSVALPKRGLIAIEVHCPSRYVSRSDFGSIRDVV